MTRTCCLLSKCTHSLICLQILIDKSIKTKLYFCCIISKQHNDPSIPEVIRNASRCGEKAKSVNGDLCQCIQIINSFK